MYEYPKRGNEHPFEDSDIGNIDKFHYIDTERDVKQSIAKACKYFGIEGCEMVIKRNYKGKTLEKLLYYYNELIGR